MSFSPRLFRELYGSTTESHGHVQVYQEVLMSYRLLFGQKRASVSLAKAELNKLREGNQLVMREGHVSEYDGLLDLLCTHLCDRHIRSLPVEL